MELEESVIRKSVFLCFVSVPPHRRTHFSELDRREEGGVWEELIIEKTQGKDSLKSCYIESNVYDLGGVKELC